MADFTWPDELAPYAVSFYLQPHTGGSESPFSRATKVYGLSAPRWVCRLAIRAPDSFDRWGGDYGTWGEQMDAFLARMEGRANRVLVHDFRRPGTGRSFTNAAITAGDTTVTLTGASAGDIREGEYIGGDGRPHIVTALQASGADLIATVKPPFAMNIIAGGATYEDVVGMFRLTSDDAGQNTSEVGQLANYELELVEDYTEPEWPFVTALPVISGTEEVGAVLSVSNGSWSNSPTGYSYQWKRDGVPIEGADDATYLLVGADEGAKVTATVKATNAAGSNNATSASVGPIEIPSPYLATVATAPAGAWAAKRLVSGYSGALYQLKRSSDSTTMDVACASGSDFPDYAAIETWRGSSTLTVVIWYDQTGNGNHLASGMTGAPATHAAPLFDTTVQHGGAAPILFATSINPVSGETNARRTLAGAISGLNAQTMTSLTVIDPISSYNALGVLTYGDVAYGTDRFAMQHAGTGLGAVFANIAGIQPYATPRVRSRPTIIGARSAAAGVTVYANGDAGTYTATPIASNAIAELTLGAFKPSGFYSRTAFFGHVAYPATLSDADVAEVVHSLNTAFAVPLSFDYRVVVTGDSIDAGSGSTSLKNAIRQLPFVNEPEIFNTATHGITLATIYTNRANRIGTLYTGAYGDGKCVFFVGGGHNSISNTVGSGATAYASLTDTITYTKALGPAARVIAQQILKSAAFTGQAEIERQDFNARVAANTAGADHVMAWASDPAFSNTSNLTYYGSDGIHPNSTGQAVRAGYMQAALQAVLGFTP